MLLFSLLSGSYLMDKYQSFSANFLAKNANSDKNGLKIFSNKIEAGWSLLPGKAGFSFTRLMNSKSLTA